jgi:lactoylglutathione lyase
MAQAIPVFPFASLPGGCRRHRPVYITALAFGDMVRTLTHRETAMTFCWATVNVKDMQESIRFYRDILGLQVNRSMKPNPDMELTFLGAGDTQIELIYNARNTEVSFGNDISLGFIVDSLDRTMETLNARDVAIHSGPFQPNPTIKFMYVLDPNGLKIQFVENIR